MFRAALILGLLASPAMAFTAKNAARVTGNSEQIVVASRSGLSDAESWCAAGDFVIRSLHMPAGTQVYRVSPPPRKPKEAVVFSLSAKGASAKTGLNTLGGAANSVSAGHAQSLCKQGRWDYF